VARRRSEGLRAEHGQLGAWIPSEPAKVYEIARDEHGKLAGRRSITVDARAMVGVG
jgi:hypothetical protein